MNGRFPWTRAATVLVALVAAAAAIALARWLLRPGPSARWEVAQSEMLIATSLEELHPSISPNGAMIAYSAGNDVQNRKIYLHRVAGGKAIRLTDDAYDDASPDWSPDGRRIAYVAYRKGEPCHLMLTGVLAGGARELGRCRTDERSHLVWADHELFFLDRPDAKSVDRIMRFDLATGRRSELTHPPAGSFGDEEPAVSPDARWLTFCRARVHLAAQRIVVDLRAGTERVLTDCVFGTGADWSDDSRTLFIGQGHGSEFALWAYPIDGGRPTRILSSPQEMGRISAGPRGLMAVEINTGNVSIARAPAAPGNPPVILDPEKGFDGSPDVAPDGTIAAFARRPLGSEIRLIRKGGAMSRLVGLGGREAYESEPRWSADGSRIAFGAMVRGAIAIRVVAAAGADLATIAFPGGSVGTPAWSADGKALIFPGRDDKGWRLWRVELAHPDKLNALPYSGWTDIRARKDELYGVRYDAPGVWRIDGTPRRITQKPSPEKANEWTIAGDEIAYVDDPFGRKRQILAQPISGGATRIVAQVPDYAWVNGFAVDPTDGSVVYSVSVRSDGDIELLHLVRQ